MTTDTATPAAAELASLRAELADLPNQIEAAIEAGDEEILARLLVRDRVLGRMITQAEQRSYDEQLAALKAERAELAKEFHRATFGLADLRLASEVYARAVVNRQQAAEPLRQQLNGLDRRIQDLETQGVTHR